MQCKEPKINPIDIIFFALCAPLCGYSSFEYAGDVMIQGNRYTNWRCGLLAGCVLGSAAVALAAAVAAPSMPPVLLTKQHQALCRIGVGDVMPPIELQQLGGRRTMLASLYGRAATLDWARINEMPAWYVIQPSKEYTIQVGSKEPETRRGEALIHGYGWEVEPGKPLMIRVKPGGAEKRRSEPRRASVAVV